MDRPSNRWAIARQTRIAAAPASPPNGRLPRRFRIGICDGTEHFSGLTRYVHAMLDGIDPDEFEVVLFCRQNSPHQPEPGIRRVFLPFDCGGNPTTPGLAPSELPGSANSNKETGSFEPVRGGWRRMAPAPLKLWSGFLRDSHRVAQTFRRCPVDLLHSQVVGSEEAIVGARLAGIERVLGTFQIDSGRSRPREWVLEFLTNHCLHRAIAVSQTTKADWVRRTHLEPSRVAVIPNSVDPARFQRRHDHTAARRLLGLESSQGSPAVVMCSVGRLTAQKGYSYLLDAMALLTASHPGLFLLLAGDGPLRPALELQAQRLGLSDRVRFLGHRNDVQAIYEASDIFALPSLWEALPFSLLEAMAAGLPAVGTTVAGVPEVIVPDQTGWLVPPADAAALATSLRPLIESAGVRERMGDAARERVVRHFSQDDMVRRTVGIYREMLDSAARGRRKAAC